MLATAAALVDAAFDSTALGSKAVLIGLLSAAPLVACLRAGRRETVVVGLYALVLSVLVGVPDGIFGTVEHIVAVLVVALVATLAVEIAGIRERAEQERLAARGLVDDVEDYSIFMLDPEGRVAGWNAGAERIKGYRAEEIIGRHFSCFYPAEDVEAGKPERGLEIARSEGRYEAEGWRVRRDGSRFLAHVVITRLRNQRGALRGFTKITRDISERRAAEEERARSERHSSMLAQTGELFETSLDYAATLEHIARLAVPALADFAFVELVQEDGSIERVAIAHSDPAKEALVRDYSRRYPVKPDAPEGSAKVIRTGQPELLKEIADSLLEAVAQDAEHLRILRGLGFRSAMVVPLRARDRTLGALSLAAAESGQLYDEADLAVAQELATLCALAIDNARLYAEARESEGKLRHQALHDPLTSLPNRTLFLDRLTVALARSGRREGQPALLFFDLDGFKRVNDSLGHDAGDELLKSIPARLEGLLRAEDTVSRFGGDEFAVICEDVPDAAQAVAIAERIVGAFEAPFELRDGTVGIAASLGLVFGRGADETPESLLRDADAAMYQAKRDGGGCHRVFDPAMEPDLRRRAGAGGPRGAA